MDGISIRDGDGNIFEIDKSHIKNSKIVDSLGKRTITLNLGLKEVQLEVAELASEILLRNRDENVQKEFMNAITERIQEHEKVTSVGSKVLTTPQPIWYTKGKTRTADLIPTQKKQLGKGRHGSVFEHRENPSHVVKKVLPKQDDNLLREFKIGHTLTHPNLVKSHEIYIKDYPNTKKEKFKIKMDKVDGSTLSEQLILLTNEEVEKLITQSKDCCLYLFQNGVAWRDLTSKNIMIENNTRNLKLVDYGFWEEQKTPKDLTMKLLIGSMELTQNILLKSGMERNILLEVCFPEPFFDDKITDLIHSIRMDSYKTAFWFVRINSQLENMNKQEMENLLTNYFDQVIKLYRN